VDKPEAAPRARKTKKRQWGNYGNACAEDLARCSVSKGWRGALMKIRVVLSYRFIILSIYYLIVDFLSIHYRFIIDLLSMEPTAGFEPATY
jgi:hypothetical protein